MTTHHPLRLGQRLRERLPPALRHAILAESSGNTPSATYGEPSNTYKYPPFLTADSDTSSSDATIIARPNPPHQETLQARRRSWEIQPGVSRREIEDLRRFHPGLVPEAVEILLNGPIVMQTYSRNNNTTIPTITATFIFDHEETKTAVIDAREVHTFAAFRAFVQKLMIAGNREYGIVGIGVGVVQGEDAWARVRFGGLGVVVVEQVLWIEKKTEKRRDWAEPKVNLMWTGKGWPPGATDN